jgi:hypothetical protein
MTTKIPPKYGCRWYGFHWNPEGWWVLSCTERDGRERVIMESFNQTHIINECLRLNCMVNDELKQKGEL